MPERSASTEDSGRPQESHESMTELRNRSMALEEQTLELARQLEDLRQLQDLSASLTRSIGLEETLREVLQRALTAFLSPQGLLVLTDPDKGPMHIGACIGLKGDLTGLVKSGEPGLGAIGRC